MSPDIPVNLAREGLMLLAVVGGPVFGGLVAIGFVVGVLQAATQINDPAVGFLPRIAAALLICWLTGGWIMERLAQFLARAMERMAAHPF